MFSKSFYQLINQLNEEMKEMVSNSNEKFSHEGIWFAFGSLIAMAMISVFIGSYRSVLYHKQQKELGKKPEYLSRKRTAKFPAIVKTIVIASVIYLLMYLDIKFEDIKLVMTVCFFVIGVMVMAHTLRPITNRFIPKAFPVIPYHLIFNKGDNETKKSLIDIKFDSRDFVTLVICGAIGVWHLFTKHWIANNVIGLAMAVYSIEFFSLNTVSNGCIILGGFFFYDIYMVFCTDFMMTLLSLDVPNKLLFPKDFFGRGVYGTQFSLLGLGDIAVPGIFMALLLRFDISLKRKTNVYFYTSYVGYTFGLVIAFVMSVYYKYGQPALLYLVPLCLSFPLFVALIKGDIKALFSYEDFPSAQEIQVNSEYKCSEIIEDESKKVQ